LRIEVHHFIHHAPDEGVASALREIKALLAGLTAAEKRDTMKIDELKAKLTADAEALRAAVERSTTLEQGSRTLLEGLNAQLLALREQIGNPDVPVEETLAAIDAQIAANQAIQDKLAADLVANTPQA
jgi:translation initiation factor 2B subunit (eIF-2B alpha/beta/delta family)